MLVRKIHTGNIVHKRLKYIIEPGETRRLFEIIESLVSAIPVRAVVHLEITGTVSDDDYTNRNSYYEKVLGGFLAYSISDDALVPAISKDKIRDEFSEYSLAAQFLEGLLSEPLEVQMAYELLKKCNESEN